MPPDPRTGSGCAVATSNLVNCARKLGVNVRVFRPTLKLPVFAAERILFNELLRYEDFSGMDAVVGIDLDGYALPRSARVHIANIKGVLADAVRFESGLTKASMAFQARLEAQHVRRADRVVTISGYCADKIRQKYGYSGPIGIVPEAIDLAEWRLRLANSGTAPPASRFVVLCVCRHYPRKRVDILLRATAQAVSHAPELLVRIIGGGPRRARWQRLSQRLGLKRNVEWIDPLPFGKLARHYSAAHAFCLPSAQEGFGIVFLEAMAAGLPVIAANAAAAPEVVPDGLLCQPECVEEFAEAILRLRDDSELRLRLARSGARRVRRYDILPVTKQFLQEISLC
jgi:glycosyltransferase involved in cell wall biosynthesis